MVLYSLILFVFLHDFDKTSKNGVYSVFQWLYMVFFQIFTHWIVKFKTPATLEILIFMKSCKIISLLRIKRSIEWYTHHFEKLEFLLIWAKSHYLKAKIRVLHTDLVCTSQIFEVCTQKLNKKVDENFSIIFCG